MPEFTQEEPQVHRQTLKRVEGVVGVGHPDGLDQVCDTLGSEMHDPRASDRCRAIFSLVQQRIQRSCLLQNFRFLALPHDLLSGQVVPLAIGGEPKLVDHPLFLWRIPGPKQIEYA